MMMVTAIAAWMAPAHATQLRLVVPVETITVGQTIFAELQLVDGSSNSMPEFQTPRGLRVQITGTGQSMTSVNFKTTRIVTYNLGITALEEGTWTFGPASLDVNGQQMVSDPVQLTVVPRSEAQQALAQVTASLSDPTPFVGEATVYEFQYRRSISTYSEELSPLQFDGFVQASDAEEHRASYALMDNGRQTHVDEIDFPLVAMTPGEHVIAPAVLTARVPDNKGPPRRGGLFGGSRNTTVETFSSDPIPVTVRPLPMAGQPDDFSGLVGQFRIRAVASADAVPLGESITLTVRMAGDGRLAGYDLPSLSGPDFQIYDDEPEYSAAVLDGRYQSSMIWRRAVVPAAEGTLVVPPMTVSVFDPDAEAYVQLRTDPVRIEVLPGEVGAGEVTSFSQGSGRQDVEVLGDDILPAPGNARIRDMRLSAALPVLVAPPALALLGLLASLLWRARPSPKLRTQLVQRLASLPSEPQERLSALEAVFRDAVGVRLGMPAPAVTREHIQTLGEEAVALDEALSRARYGGGQALQGLDDRVRAFLEAT